MIITVAGFIINSLRICLTDYKGLSYYIVIETGDLIMISKLINNIKMLFKISKGSTLSMYRVRCSIFDTKGSPIRDEILYMRLTDNITQGGFRRIHE